MSTKVPQPNPRNTSGQDLSVLCPQSDKKQPRVCEDVTIRHSLGIVTDDKASTLHMLASPLWAGPDSMAMHIFFCVGLVPYTNLLAHREPKRATRPVGWSERLLKIFVEFKQIEEGSRQVATRDVATRLLAFRPHLAVSIPRWLDTHHFRRRQAQSSVRMNTVVSPQEWKSFIPRRP